MDCCVSSGPAEIIERKVSPDGSVTYYVHYMDCEAPSHPCYVGIEKEPAFKSTS